MASRVSTLDVPSGHGRSHILPLWRPPKLLEVRLPCLSLQPIGLPFRRWSSHDSPLNTAIGTANESLGRVHFPSDPLSMADGGRFDIACGVNRGQRHTVVDLTANVEVVVGRKFWYWMNGGQEKTQEWRPLRYSSCKHLTPWRGLMPARIGAARWVWRAAPRAGETRSKPGSGSGRPRDTG